jgi:protein-S-isoprenylcysteine O-methyltransferase Ste14
MPQFLVGPHTARHQTTSIDRGPGTPVPPLSLFFLGFIAAWFWDRQHPWSISLDQTGHALLLAVGTALVAAGTGLFAWGMQTFANARTGILLQRAATRVVNQGPYRWTRNPMYVGSVAVYVGFALLLNTIWPLVALPVVVYALTTIVIAREEAYMRRRFGVDYDDYCQRVPRWL